MGMAGNRIDANLIPEKIKKDETIYGIVGTFGGGWTAPADWGDMPMVDDEIFILVKDDGAGPTVNETDYNFTITTSGGTFAIDWGDGTVETGKTSGDHGHTYTDGTGTACSRGYTTFKIRIYDITATVTVFRVIVPTVATFNRFPGILRFVCGIDTLTSAHTMFYGTITNAGIRCRIIESVEIKSLENTTTKANMCSECRSLQKVEIGGANIGSGSCSEMFLNCRALCEATIPTSWGTSDTTAGMFSGCHVLCEATIPTSWGSVTDTSNMFRNCFLLFSITLPTSWGSVTNATSMFNACSGLTEITLGTDWGTGEFGTAGTAGNTGVASMFANCQLLNKVTLPGAFGKIRNANNMFISCFSLEEIVNLEYLGSVDGTEQCSMIGICNSNEQLKGTLTFGSNLFRLVMLGLATLRPNQVTTIRLTGTGSTFTGASPHIDILNNSLDTAELDTLFGDLPTLVSKTIRVTGNPGASTCDQTIANGKGWTVTA